MVSGHLLVAEALGQEVGDALGEPARVDEDQRRPVRPHVGGDAVEDLAPLLVGRRRPRAARRQLDGQIESAPVSEVDDVAHGGAVGAAPALAGADQEPRDGVDGPLGGGEPDALRALGAQRVEPLERQRQM